MKGFILTTLLLAGMTGTRVYCQEQVPGLFSEGMFFFNRGEYEDAAFYFRQLVEAKPGNAHYQFLLGECYLNIPGREPLAIEHLEKATEKTVSKKKYRARDPEETRAPLHAWFYLGNAYRVANRLSDALHAYGQFINNPGYYGNYNQNIVENEIRSCERAKIIQDHPVPLRTVLPDSNVNTAADEIHPVISASGQTLVFVRRLKFYDAVLQCRYSDGNWSEPENISPQIGSDGDMYPVSLSASGQMLFLVKRATGNNDLYVSVFDGKQWTRAIPLGKNINTRSHENGACLAPDGQTLYFSSARKGGWGGTDLYSSQLGPDGEWGKATNLGRVLNTEFDEDAPAVPSHEGILYFSSKGHYSMGGFDYFYSFNKEGRWQEPVNLGSPVNSTSDNLGLSVLDDGRSISLSARMSTEGQESEDILLLIFSNGLPKP